MAFCFDQEGLDINRPPIFDGNDFLSWKIRIKFFLMGQDFQLWDFVSNGPNGFSNVDRIASLNDNAMHILHDALEKCVFDKVSMCKSAFEIWCRLEQIYVKGINEVEEAKEEKCLVIFTNDAPSSSNNHKESDEVISNSNDDDIDDYDEITFEQMVEIALAYKKKKKKISSKYKECKNLLDESRIENEKLKNNLLVLESKSVNVASDDCLIVNNNDGLKNQLDACLNENDSLKKEIEALKESLSTFIKGKEKLDCMLGAQKCANDKHGLGFVDANVSSDVKTVFVKGKNLEDELPKPLIVNEASSSKIHARPSFRDVASSSRTQSRNVHHAFMYKPRLVQKKKMHVSNNRHNFFRNAHSSQNAFKSHSMHVRQKFAHTHAHRNVSFAHSHLHPMHAHASRNVSNVHFRPKSHPRRNMHQRNDIHSSRIHKRNFMSLHPHTHHKNTFRNKDMHTYHPRMQYFQENRMHNIRPYFRQSRPISSHVPHMHYYSSRNAYHAHPRPSNMFHTHSRYNVHHGRTFRDSRPRNAYKSHVRPNDMFHRHNGMMNFHNSHMHDYHHRNANVSRRNAFRHQDHRIHDHMHKSTYVCNFCGRLGHVEKFCFSKLFQFHDSPMALGGRKATNPQGPKLMWVPRTK